MEQNKLLNRVTAIIAMALSTITFSAHATFMVDSNPGGQMFFIDKPADGSTTFCGTVGINRPCTTAVNAREVDVTTNTGVRTGNGYANIVSDTGAPLTTLTFTPENPGVWNDFSFRGQLSEPSNPGGTPVVISVNGTQTFDFFPGIANADFQRIGIISSTMEPETIDAVTISFAGGFRQVKQIDFSSGIIPAVPEPATFALMSIGLAGMAFGKRKKLP